MRKSIITKIIFLILSIPLLYSIVIAFKSSSTNISFYEEIVNTIIIVSFVGVGTMLVGASLAYIVANYQFKYKKFISILFALPLAFPPYIMAKAYGDFFYYQGLFPTFLSFFNIRKHFDILNIYGVIFIYIITLYPYVYLTCLSYYRHLNSAILDTARTLNTSRLRLFFKVGLPIAYFPILTGVLLVMMEVISDFGVVDYYGVSVFSTTIYKLWMSYSDSVAAIRLSLIVVAVFGLFTYLMIKMKANVKYFISGKSNRKTNMHFSSILPYFLMWFWIVVVLMIPLSQLIYQASFVVTTLFQQETFIVMLNTIVICFIASLICLVLAIIIAKENQFKKHGLAKMIVVGYAIPGVIVALMILFTLCDFDMLMKPIYQSLQLEKLNVLSISIFALIFGYTLRFLGIGLQSVQAGYQKMNPTLYKVNQTLQKSKYFALLHIDFPILKATFIYSFLLVFLEILKELPITLILKPFQIETLTTFVTQYHHNEQTHLAALYSLLIVVIAMFFVTILMLQKGKKHAGN